MSGLTPGAIRKLNVTELRSELAKLELDTKGYKQDLIDRLLAADVGLAGGGTQAEETSTVLRNRRGDGSERMAISSEESHGNSDKNGVEAIRANLYSKTSDADANECISLTAHHSIITKHLETILDGMALLTEDLDQLKRNNAALLKKNDELTDIVSKLRVELTGTSSSDLHVYEVPDSPLQTRESPPSVSSQLEDYRSHHKLKYQHLKSANPQTAAQEPTVKSKSKRNKKKNKNQDTSVPPVKKLSEAQRRSSKPKNNNTPGMRQGPRSTGVRNNPRERTVVIVGDSIVKNVQGWKLSDDNRTVVKSFPGAKVDDMFHYVKPTLNHQPEEIIIHVGTNDVKHSTPRAIAERIADLGNSITAEVSHTKVTISSLLCRADDRSLNTKVKEINKILKVFANQNEWQFLVHSNITSSHLNPNGLHLNHKGSQVLSSNFSKHINGNN